MFNLFKKSKLEPIKPCGVIRMTLDQQADFNDVFRSAKRELDDLYLSGLPKHKQPNRFHLNTFRTV